MTAGPMRQLLARDKQSITFQLGGREMLLAPTPPAFLDALSIGDPLAIVPGLCHRADAGWLVYQLRQRDSGVTLRLLRQMAIECTAQLCGVPWWVGWRLSGMMAAQHMELMGRMWARGFDPATAPVHRTLAVVYSLMTDGAAGDDLVKFDEGLWAVPPDLAELDIQGGPRVVITVSGGRKVVPSAEEQDNSFQAFAAAMGGASAGDGFIDF